MYEKYNVLYEFLDLLLLSNLDTIISLSLHSSDLNNKEWQV